MPINEAKTPSKGQRITNPATSHPKAAARAQPSTSNPAPPAYTANTPATTSPPLPRFALHPVHTPHRLRKQRSCTPGVRASHATSGIHTRPLHGPRRDGEVVDVVPHHVDGMDAVAHVGDVLLVQEGLVARGEDVGRGAVLPAEGLGDFEHVAAVHVGVFAGGGGGAVEG